MMTANAGIQGTQGQRKTSPVNTLDPASFATCGTAVLLDCIFFGKHARTAIGKSVNTTMTP